jgi:uncharacterized membrane protein
MRGGLVVTTIEAPGERMRSESPFTPLPPGWAWNPSAWRERLPLVLLALGGCGVAAYLTLYQVGLFQTVWEPFFGTGSRTILHSSVAQFLPIPDAALGALAYLLEAACGLLGGTARWRTAPWLVLAYGGLVGLLGLGSVALLIAQPVAFGAWCTLCLVSAAISIGLLGPALREPLAALQHLRREYEHGDSLWQAFWGHGAAARR